MPLLSMLVIYANQNPPPQTKPRSLTPIRGTIYLKFKIHDLPLFLYIFTLPRETLPLWVTRLWCSLPSYGPSILTVVLVMRGGWFLPSFGPLFFPFLLMGRCGGGGDAWWMIPSILRPISLFIPFNGTVRWGGGGCMMDDSFHPLAHLSFPSFKWNWDSRPKGWGRIHGFQPPDQNQDEQSAFKLLAPLPTCLPRVSIFHEPVVVPSSDAWWARL